ncbi:MAG: homocysteine methyltransferase, partial [Spirochaetes bacterium GWB1_48_6]
LAWAQFLQDHEKVDVAGMNLIGPSDALEALEILKKVVKKPLAVQPDSGFPKEVDGRQFYLTTPDYFAEYAKFFLDMGAGIIGGCCGTTPEHIEKMSRTLVSFDRGRKNTSLSVSETSGKARPEIPQDQRSNLGKDLALGNWISTVELVSPLGWDLTKILEKAQALASAGVKYVNIPDGPRASARISALTTAVEILRKTGLEPILHVATRDKNLLGLQGDLFGGHAQGLRDVLLITGDPPKVGKYPNVTGVFDVDSIGLTRMVKGFNQGLDFGGEELPDTSSFVYGCGVNPAFPSMEMELERAFKKAEAGAEFFITQPVWDQDKLQEFLEKLKATGVPVLLGLWPLASYRNALFLNSEVPGVVIPQDILERMKKHEDKEAARAAGVAISREILKRMKPWVNGIQVSPPFGNVKTALEVLAP